MQSSKRKAIEAAGWKVGDAADFLGMDDEERQLLDVRVALARAVREQRELGSTVAIEVGRTNANDPASRRQD